MRQVPVAVIGAGAVGSYFGGMLARGGSPVTLIGRSAHVAAVRRSGLSIERATGTEQIEVQASTELRAAAGAPLVLLCVKTPDTEEAARAARPHLMPDALVLSLQNGVDNVERIHRAAGITAAVGIVYVAADLTSPGRVRHGGRGDLIIGALPGHPLPASQRPSLSEVAELFEQCKVPCRLVSDIQPHLWTKMIMNCAYNAISAIARVPYGELTRDAAGHRLMQEVVTEAVAVARAAGVPLEEGEVGRAVFELADAMPTATSSTAQDLARGRRTEIDALNGYVAQQGERLEVPVPFNRTLHTLVKLLEARSLKPEA
jgi:2-dehydropantoate 2-reductase